MNVDLPRERLTSKDTFFVATVEHRSQKHEYRRVVACMYSMPFHDVSRGEHACRYDSVCWIDEWNGACLLCLCCCNLWNIILIM